MAVSSRLNQRSKSCDWSPPTISTRVPAPQSNFRGAARRRAAAWRRSMVFASASSAVIANVAVATWLSKLASSTRVDHPLLGEGYREPTHLSCPGQTRERSASREHRGGGCSPRTPVRCGTRGPRAFRRRSTPWPSSLVPCAPGRHPTGSPSQRRRRGSAGCWRESRLRSWPSAAWTSRTPPGIGAALEHDRVESRSGWRRGSTTLNGTPSTLMVPNFLKFHAARRDVPANTSVRVSAENAFDKIDDPEALAVERRHVREHIAQRPPHPTHRGSSGISERPVDRRLRMSRLRISTSPSTWRKTRVRGSPTR